MNSYTVNVSEKDKLHTIVFSAQDIQEAYFLAGQHIINKYDNLSEESCSLLSSSDMNNWDTICDKVYDLDELDISDVKEDDKDWT